MLMAYHFSSGISLNREPNGRKDLYNQHKIVVVCCDMWLILRFKRSGKC